jgi:hypothetical protein
MTRTLKPSLGEMTWMLGRNTRAEKAAPGNTKAKFLVASIVAAIGFLTWTVVSGRSDAEIQPASTYPAAIGLAQDTSLSDPASTPTQATLAAPADASSPAEPVAAGIAPIDGLKISSQFWRRGGLGSNALVTLTLRNRNDYAVKDIEISCTFTRSDGSHLTDRTRVIPDIVNTRSRKTFARLHVGFVNVNASKAKCALVAASHI